MSAFWYALRDVSREQWKGSLVFADVVATVIANDPLRDAVEACWRLNGLDLHKTVQDVGMLLCEGDAARARGEGDYDERIKARDYFRSMWQSPV